VLPRPASRPARFALPLAATLMLAGCSTYGFFSYPPQSRGSQVDPDQIKQLVPGTSTQKDVTALLGSPLAHASFDDNTWLYISQVTVPVIAGTQAVEKQRVYALSFDQRGVLTKVEERTKKDALPVAVVSRTTPSPGSNPTLLQQLLGNIGRYTPAGLPGGGGGNTNPGNF
jgi:outer membrane protein assembly factor BamE (lipoprotein component of BamABCDE complex)